MAISVVVGVAVCLMMLGFHADMAVSLVLMLTVEVVAVAGRKPHPSG